VPFGGAEQPVPSGLTQKETLQIGRENVNEIKRIRNKIPNRIIVIFCYMRKTEGFM
jgi:hypothetical protein